MSVLRGVLFATMLFSVNAWAATIERIDSVPYGDKRGAQHYAVIDPDKTPELVGVFFIGGEGKLNLAQRGEVRSSNPLVKLKADLLATLPMRLIYVDAPDALGATRIEKDYTDSVHRILARENPQTLPVYVFGISWGSTSATAVSASDPAGYVRGMVILSALQRRTAYTVYSTPLNQIKAHALLIQHVKDACPSTSGNLFAVKSLGSRLTSSPSVTPIALDGGEPGHGDPCSPESYHGFLGIEPVLFDHMVKWIASTQPSRR